MEESPLKAKCSICDTNHLTGDFDKNFHNLRTHLDSRSHKLNIELKYSDKDPFAGMWVDIEKHHPNQYTRKQNTIVCRLDGKVIKLDAVAGDPIARASAHIAGNTHVKHRQMKKKSAPTSKKIDAFFKKQE